MILLIILSFLLVQCELPSSGTSGKVIKVKDGDSLVLLEEGHIETEIRMAHIDAPERSQPFGTKAKQSLSDLCFGQMVTYRETDDPDRYGRLIAEIILQDGTIVNQKMVEQGMAWHFKEYSNSFKYGQLERNARRNRLGLWADQHPTPPWEYRKEKRK